MLRIIARVLHAIAISWAKAYLPNKNKRGVLNLLAHDFSE
jgi:hypothetical protein